MGELSESVELCITEIPYRFAKDHQVVVFELLSSEVKLKCTSNTPLQVFSEVSSFFRKSLIVERVSVEEFEKVISSIYGEASASSSDLAEDIDDNYDLNALAENLPQTSDLLDTPVSTLLAGDKTIEFTDDYNTDAFIFVKQDQPLPCSILAIYPTFVISDG